MIATLGGVMFALLWLVSVAWPCSFVGPEEHIVTENLADTTAPDAPEAAVSEIKRGVGPECSGGSCVTSSCDDIGTLSLALSSSDDVSAADAIGFELTLVEGGTLPDGLELSTTGMVAVRTDESGVLLLTWIDDAEDDQEAFSFEVDIAAIDEAGNVSDATRLSVEHAGTSGGGLGCNSAPGVSGGALALAGLAGLALGRRRTRR
jgi:MYXO-CTERM domain-containing protein